MTKRKKQIIAVFGVLFILVAVLLVLLLTDKKPQTTTDTDTEILDDDGITLIDTDVKDLRTVEITTAFGTYNIEQVGESATTDSDVTYRYAIAGYEGVPTDEGVLNKAIKTSTQIFANDLIEENSKRLNEFGLDNPVSTVKQIYYDGKEISFSIGNETPSGDKYYLTMNGESTVYEVAKVYIENLMYDKTHFINCTIKEAVDSYPDIDEITVTRQDLLRPVKIVPMTDSDWAIYKSDDESVTASFSQYKMVSPVETTLDISDQSGIMYSLWGMTASSAVKANPDANELSACGFDNPYCTYEIVIDGKTQTLTFGNVIEGAGENGEIYRYGMISDRNILYSFKEDDVYFLKFSPEDVITRMLISPYIYNLSYVNIKYDGKDYNFTITANTEDLDNSVFECNGTAVDGKNFREFYQYLHKAMVQSISYNPVSAQPDMTIEYGFVNQSIKPITVDFYKSDTRTVTVGENGEIKFTTTASYYERLIENLNRLLGGETIIHTW